MLALGTATIWLRSPGRWWTPPPRSSRTKRVSEASEEFPSFHCATPPTTVPFSARFEVHKKSPPTKRLLVGGLLIQSAEETATSARRSSKTRIFVSPSLCLLLAPAFCFSSPKIKREMNKSRPLFHTSTPPRSRVKSQGSRIKDQGSRIKDQGSRIKDQGSRIEDQGSRIKDQGFFMVFDCWIARRKGGSDFNLSFVLIKLMMV